MPVVQMLAWVGILQALQAINVDILMARDRTSTLFRYSIVLHARRTRDRVLDRPAVGRRRRRGRLRDLEHAGRAGPDRPDRARLGVSPWVFVRSIAGVARRRPAWRRVLLAGRIALVDAGVARRRPARAPDRRRRRPSSALCLWWRARDPARHRLGDRRLAAGARRPARDRGRLAGISGSGARARARRLGTLLGRPVARASRRARLDGRTRAQPAPRSRRATSPRRSRTTAARRPRRSRPCRRGRASPRPPACRRRNASAAVAPQRPRAAGRRRPAAAPRAGAPLEADAQRLAVDRPRRTRRRGAAPHARRGAGRRPALGRIRPARAELVGAGVRATRRSRGARGVGRGIVRRGRRRRSPRRPARGASRGRTRRLNWRNAEGDLGPSRRTGDR